MAIATQEREAEVLRRLTESEAGQAMLAEQAAELVKERASKVAEIVTARAAAETELPPLRDAVAKALTKAEKAKEAYDSAVTAWRTADSAGDGASTASRSLIERLEGELRETADPAIGAFIHEMSGEYDATRRSGSTNYDATNARLAAITAARAEAEAMKLEALTADELQARLQALADGLPTLR